MKDRTTLAWIDPRTLDADASRALWAFVSRYEEISLADCDARLRELTCALVGRHADGAVGALVAAKIFAARCGGRPATLVWGEWGLCDAPFRGRMLLERAMLRGVLSARLQGSLGAVYFMAEAASCQGYLALARGFAHLWPAPGKALPEAERRMVAAVLASAADRSWDPARGVFHRGKPLRADGEQGPDHLEALRAYYRGVNPGQAQGDTLLCVARVSWASLLAMPLRTLHSRRRRPSIARSELARA